MRIYASFHKPCIYVRIVLFMYLLYCNIPWAFRHFLCNALLCDYVIICCNNFWLFCSWVSRQSQPTSKPTVPPKPQSFQSVAPPGRRSVGLRVSMASEGSAAVETVAVSEPTVRNGSCGMTHLVLWSSF